LGNAECEGAAGAILTPAMLEFGNQRKRLAPFGQAGQLRGWPAGKQ